MPNLSHRLRAVWHASHTPLECPERAQTVAIATRDPRVDRAGLSDAMHDARVHFPDRCMLGLVCASVYFVNTSVLIVARASHATTNTDTTSGSAQ